MRHSFITRHTYASGPTLRDYARYRKCFDLLPYSTVRVVVAPRHTSTAHNWAQLNSLSACHTITAWHPPDADGLVVASRCHHIRVARVPRNGVDGARMTRKHLRTLWIRL